MNKEELIVKIRNDYKELSKVESASSLESKAKQILELVYALGDLDSAYHNASDELDHTIRKEVSYALSSEKDMFKKNAAKIRKVEFRKDLEDAIFQISLDLSSILN